jgi:hypothetical protein
MVEGQWRDKEIKGTSPCRAPLGTRTRAGVHAVAQAVENVAVGDTETVRSSRANCAWRAERG